MADIRERIGETFAKLNRIKNRVSGPLSDRLKSLTEALTSLVAAIESGKISAVDANEMLEELLAALDELLIAINSSTDASSNGDVTDHLANVENILSNLGVTQPQLPGHN